MNNVAERSAIGHRICAVDTQNCRKSQGLQPLAVGHSWIQNSAERETYSHTLKHKVMASYILWKTKWVCSSSALGLSCAQNPSRKE